MICTMWLNGVRGFFVGLRRAARWTSHSSLLAGLWLHRAEDGAVRIVGLGSGKRSSRGPLEPCNASGLSSDGGPLDPVVTALGAALLPALEQPKSANAAYIELIVRALDVHLAACVGYADSGRRSAKLHLAAWQERRAKEFLIANLANAISVSEVAAQCNLSRSHFSSAFRAATGYAPHRWLLQYRVEKAHDLLRGPMPLSSIALVCGFTDQSHLTRAFKRIFGITPGRWRRQGGSPLADATDGEQRSGVPGTSTTPLQRGSGNSAAHSPRTI